MDAKTRIEISLRAAVIIKDMSNLVDCDNVECMLEPFSRAVSRMHELDKVLASELKNEEIGGAE